MASEGSPSCSPTASDLERHDDPRGVGRDNRLVLKVRVAKLVLGEQQIGSYLASSWQGAARVSAVAARSTGDRWRSAALTSSMVVHVWRRRSAGTPK